MNWADIDHKRDIIRVWGKGAKQRVMRYGPYTKKLIGMWSEESDAGVVGSLLGIWENSPAAGQDISVHTRKPPK